MQHYRAVVIGVGAAVPAPVRKGGGYQVGYTHAEMYRRSGRVDLVAGVDINDENLRAFNQRFGLSGGFNDYRAALRELRPDFASISTYVGLHRPIIEAAVDAGVRAIICEKPFLNSPADCAAVRKLLKGSPAKLIVAHPRRYRPAFVRVAELVRAGAIGQTRLLQTNMDTWDLNEMGSHWFDLLRMFVGDQPVAWVFGQARVRDFRGFGHAMEDHAVAYLSFADGTRAVVEGGIRMPGPDAINLVGAHGMIHVYDEHELAIENRAGATRESFKDQPPDGWNDLNIQGPSDLWINLWDVMLAGHLRWIEGGDPPAVAFDNAVQTCEATLAAYVSAIRGDRVDLPFAQPDLAIAEYPVEILARKSPHA